MDTFEFPAPKHATHKQMKAFFETEDDKPISEKAPSATRGDILLDAHKTINGRRQDVYGKPEDSFECIGLLWQIIDSHKPDDLSNSANVALKMMGMKFARLIANPYDLDSIRDLCGYAGIFADMTNAKDKEKE